MQGIQNTRTTIAVHQNTLNRLGEVGAFKETYEDVINRLLDVNTERMRDER